MTSYQMTHVISEIPIKHALLGEATGRVGTRVLVLQNERIHQPGSSKKNAVVGCLRLIMTCFGDLW